jgi:hypothetical protein
MAASFSALDNPFVDSIVRDPWSDPQAEVPDIGRTAFEVCRREIENVRGFRISRSVLLHGESGCGKTHLVARIRRFLEGQASHRWLDSVFVSVQMQTSPGRIWRHLRRRFAEDLLRRPAAGPSQLDRIVFRRMADTDSRGGYLDDWREKILAGYPRGPGDAEPLAMALWTIVEHLDREGALDILQGDLYSRLGGDANIPVALQRVLRHAAQRRHQSLAHASLRGESLTEADLAILGIEPVTGAEEDEEPEDEAREAVLTLVRLAAVPVVFCLDQLEALESSPNDVTGFMALGNAATSLHDLTGNSLVISCIQSQYIDKLKGTLGAGYARISESEQRLAGVDRGDAAQLIGARLGDCATDYRDRVRMENFEDLFDANTGLATPRRVIARAAELFERTIPVTGRQPVADALAERWERYLEQAERTNRPELSDQILEHGLPLLLQLGSAKRAIGNGSRDLQFTVSGGSAPGAAPMGVSVCNQTNMRSLAGRFRRLRSDILPPDRLVIVRDARLPISRASRRTRQYLDELSSSGARLVHPAPEALAALEALRVLLSEAKAGDLASGGEPIGPATVEEWLASNLPLSLAGLIHDLSPEVSSPQDIDFRENLIEFLEERLLVPVAEAARALGQAESKVVSCAAANPGAIGYLTGPPALLYHAVMGTAV